MTICSRLDTMSRHAHRLGCMLRMCRTCRKQCSLRCAWHIWIAELTKVLAAVCAAGIIRGDVRVSGHPKVQETFARIMGYVEQYDIHSPNVRRDRAPAIAWCRACAGCSPVSPDSQNAHVVLA